MTQVDWARIEPSEALAELMRQDREREPDAPIGGWRGEWAVQQDEPPRVPPQPFVFPPPDWRAEQAERDRVRAAEAQARTEPRLLPGAPWRPEAPTVARMNTVYGVLADEFGHASAGGNHWASPAADYLREQAPRIRIDQDHSHRWVGEIVFLARHGGRLLAVGEVDGVAEAVNVRVGSRTVAVPTPLYWSSTRIGGGGDGLLLDSVSLTASTARVHPRPVTFLEGRLDHRQAAQRWRSRLDRVEFTLLERAAIARADRSRGDPILIDELTPPTQATKLGRNGGWIDRHGDRLYAFQSRHADAYDDERTSGKLRMRPCRIIAVR